MPRVPGVPELEPVSKPMESPAEAGRAGEAIAGLGDSLNDDTLQMQAVNLFKKRAQQSVDEIAAQNQAHAAMIQYEDQLAKTPNSRDIPDVAKAARDNLNGIAKQWSKSPASVAIQQQLDGLTPQIDHLGNVRGIDLMGKELKINLDYQAKTLATDYASGNRDGALAAFTSAVDSPGGKLLLGDAERGAYIRDFKQQGQELQIKNDITNADPSVNQRIYDQINGHPELFPDVTKEQLDTYKGQALAAQESHIKHQDWVEGQMAEKTMLRPLIDQHTNPATKQFDEAAALDDVAKRFTDGTITATQRDVLSEGVKAQQTDLKVGIDQQAGKLKDDIVKTFDAHNYKQGYAQLEATRPWFEANGHSDLYEGLHKYGEQMQREQRVEGREEFALSRQLQTERSNETLGNVLLALSQGHVFTDAQLYGMAGDGKGQMKSPDVLEAIRASKAYESDPNTQAAVKLMSDSFPITSLSKDATPEQVAAAAEPNARQSKRLALTYQQWQARINQNPTEDRVAAMKDVLQPAIQEQISDQINKVFGVPVVKPPLSLRVEKFFTTGFFTPSPNSIIGKQNAAKQQSSPAGTIRVKEKATGRTGTIPASEYDEKVYEKVQ